MSRKKGSSRKNQGLEDFMDEESLRDIGKSSFWARQAAPYESGDKPRN